MTTEKRQPITGAEVTKETKSGNYKTFETWSLNVPKVKFVLYLILAVITICGSVFGVGAFAVGRMESAAETNFKMRIEKRLNEELTPPDGDIWQAINHEVSETDETLKRSIDDLVSSVDELIDKEILRDKKDVRQGIMANEMYLTVTGRQPPPEIME